MNTTSTTARVTAFFAAAVVASVLLGSQFGLARHYDDQAGALLAAQPAAGLVALAKTPASAPRA